MAGNGWTVMSAFIYVVYVADLGRSSFVINQPEMGISSWQVTSKVSLIGLPVLQ